MLHDRAVGLAPAHVQLLQLREPAPVTGEPLGQAPPRVAPLHDVRRGLDLGHARDSPEPPEGGACGPCGLAPVGGGDACGGWILGILDFVAPPLLNTQRIGSLPVLPCPVDPELTRRVLDRGGEALAHMLRQQQLDAVVDLGRVGDDSAALPLAVQADQVLLVARPRFDEVQALLFRRRLLFQAGCTVGLVTVGDEPHHPAEVAEFTELPLVAALPDDAAVASAFCGGRFDGKRLVRTRLWSTILGLADRLGPDVRAAGRAAAPGAPPPPPPPEPAQERAREPVT